MSSKLTVKQSKKDRPRSSDKLRKGKRDGTPEKPTTPNASQDVLQEDGAPQPEKKQIIINDEILAMAIKEEALQKLREPNPPAERKRSPPACSVVVRKLKPASEWDRPTPRIVTVAKPAPPDAPLKPVDYADGAGPRFDHEGNVVPHSILGSVEDYKKMAFKSGDLPAELAQVSAAEKQPRQMSAKYVREKTSRHPVMESVDESNALKNWTERMRERKRQQGYLSKLLNKAPEQLVMNQSDTYRQTQELRYLIDRTIPCMDYGKGYRVGSEFWNQQERIGNELTGIHMTLSQTERGYPPPVEHVGVPKTILEEKGTNWSRPTTPFHKPWHKTPYLRERKEQLQPVMNELDPHQPDLMKLEIVGSSKPSEEHGAQGTITVSEPTASRLGMVRPTTEDTQDVDDPLKDHPDVHPAPVFGPSILFAGQPARWTGDSSNFKGEVGIDARVTFEAYAGHRVTSYLEIVNDGTTAIYYDWKKVPKKNAFDIVNAKVHRFYFNNSSGVILPGDTIKFPFVFKSPNAGVFTEQWEFETHPVVCGGAALIVTLRGVALQEDKFKRQRTELEMELAHKQAEQIVSGILSDMIEGIREPERPKSAIDAYITDEEVFNRKNPGLHFSHGSITNLQNLFKELVPEEDQEYNTWDLSVETLKEMIMSLDEDDDSKQGYLLRLNQAVISMSFPPFTPKQQQMYCVGYEMLCEMLDTMTERCLNIRNVLGMPERDAEDIPDEPASDKKTPTGRQSKTDTRDKKGGKDSKAPPKTPGGKSGGKITPAPSKTRPATRDRSVTPSSEVVTPVQSGVDPVLASKYKNKVYTQTYTLFAETMDTMGQAFENIQRLEGGPKLPKM